MSTAGEHGAPERRPDRTLGPLDGGLGGHDRFWEHCAKEELWLPRCETCGTYVWPVAAACSGCGEKSLGWRQVSGRATLVAWNVFHQDYYKGMLPVPYATILVELEEGPLFMSNPAGFGEAEMEPGMALAVRFLACEDSAGCFNLPVFARA